MADPKEKQIDDIVSMLDQFMAGNGGHMNIRVSEDGTVSTDETMAKSVTTTIKWQISANLKSITLLIY